MAPIPQITCAEPNAVIGLQTTNPNFVYFWEDEDGFSLDEDQFQIEISEAGTYLLTVTNQENGCTNDFQFVVEALGEMPSLAFGGDTELSCLAGTLDLAATTDASMPTYAWGTQNGNITGGANNQIVELDAPGIYSVTITDGLTGCTVVDNIEVTNDDDAPSIDFMPADIPVSYTHLTLPTIYSV